MTMDNG